MQKDFKTSKCWPWHYLIIWWNIKWLNFFPAYVKQSWYLELLDLQMLLGFFLLLFFSLNPTVQLLTGFVASRDLWLTGVKGASALSRSLSSFPVSFHCHLKNALNSQEWFCQDSQEETQIASEHITHIARFSADWGTWVFRTEALLYCEVHQIEKFALVSKFSYHARRLWTCPEYKL